MKYQRTASFLDDYARLTERERELFRAAVRWRRIGGHAICHEP